MTKPGVQKPHCSPWQSRSADWTGDSSPSGDAMPSTVVTSMPSGLDGEHQAGPDGLVVEEHGARTAGSVLAAQVGAGESALLAQVVRQGQPWLDDRLGGSAVHRDRDR